MTSDEFHANVYAAWTTLSLIGSIIFGVVAARFVLRDGVPAMALRVQLGFALSMVLLGDAINRGVAWLFWELRARNVRFAWTDAYLFISDVGAICALIGVSTAIRAVSYERYGNRLWIGVLIVTFIMVAL